MDPQNQQRIKEAAESYGAENCVVILGLSDTESAEIYAETVSNGDPAFVGPLAGVSLKLPVYHIFDEDIRSECDPAQWGKQVSMAEALLEPEELASAVRGIREKYSLKL